MRSLKRARPRVSVEALAELAVKTRAATGFDRDDRYGDLRKLSNSKETRKRTGWRKTRKEVGGGIDRRVFGLDCEMVECLLAPRECSIPPSSPADDLKSTRRELVVARVAIVEYAVGEDTCRRVLDVCVRTPVGATVVDFLTPVSGITAEMLTAADAVEWEEARRLVLECMTSKDILIGHSLWADLKCLRVWHPTILDTSLIITLKHAPKMTLGLRDLVAIFLAEDWEHANLFQTSTHDPGIDAEAAVRAAVAAHERQYFSVVEVPDRMAKKLRVQNMTAGMYEAIGEAFVGAAEISEFRCSASGLGSCVVAFESAFTARAAFDAVQTPQCCHSEGWPDRSGFWRKSVSVGGGIAEVVTQFRATIVASVCVEIPKAAEGGIFGKRGANVIAIQRKHGVRISSTKAKAQTTLKIEGPSEDNVAAARAAIEEAKSP